ncbi:hypothetical protein QTI33_15225 [Variovorax sp. J22P271]|uniref:hypothetical protein n=1 Tax=Variovorax davisae TaxID=3053515 RepID=UPI002575CA24|nr:hypothetical protein [Variovorax sp. J22P271]MDM0033485.1 hypothetical protein [Variovorax sp. J22P271]
MNTVHNTRFESAKYPDLLGSVAYDCFGDLNRASYFAVIRNGRPQIAATIRSAEGGMVGADCFALSRTQRLAVGNFSRKRSVVIRRSPVRIGFSSVGLTFTALAAPGDPRARR